ncbi:hypothetical protein GCM10027075_28680 [Streptomyces heilongjiangensis]
MRVRVDEARCCGAGQCVLLAPEVFDQRDADGVVALLTPEPAPPHHPAAREAAAVCPTSAITVDESGDTGGDRAGDGSRGGNRDDGQDG